MKSSINKIELLHNFLKIIIKWSFTSKILHSSGMFGIMSSVTFNSFLYRKSETCMLRNKLYIKMWSVVGVKPVNTAPIGLYTKSRKTRTFEIYVMQKLHIGKLSNFAHIISTYMVVCTDITKLVLNWVLQIYNNTVLQQYVIIL